MSRARAEMIEQTRARLLASARQAFAAQGFWACGQRRFLDQRVPAAAAFAFADPFAMRGTAGGAGESGSLASANVGATAAYQPG